VPLAVSIWGNDLTHEAPHNWLSARATRRVLARTNLLFTDCQRDIDLARTWGLRPGVLTEIVPGGGGIGLGCAEEEPAPSSPLADLAGHGRPLVVNPRGARPYVRNDVLLEALSILADDLDPGVRVVFVDAAHDAGIRRSLERHRLKDRIVLLGRCSPAELRFLFRHAQVSASITDQDGTPNSLLEAMAAGTIPVCSDLPSIREWIEPSTNGFLAACDDPQAVAGAIRLALSQSDAESHAIRTRNLRLIELRADRARAGQLAAARYREAAPYASTLTGSAAGTQPAPRA
jgi:glycosyltransferase involved in cell wall biosynthesis